jgi:CRISPR-associated endonuclease Csn1
MQLDNPRLRISDENWREIEAIIFRQRPLKSQKHLRSSCQLERNQFGCARARLIAQEFRVRSALVNLRYREPGGLEHRLTAEQCGACFDVIWRGQNLTEARFQKALGLSKATRWNLDSSDVRSLQAPTVARIIGALEGEGQLGLPFWAGLGEDQAQFVDTLLSFEKAGPLKDHLMKIYGSSNSRFPHILKAEQAARLAVINFEEGYLSYSAKAMRKLMPFLLRGQRLDRSEASRHDSPIESLYPSPPVTKREKLPPASEIVAGIRNPVVMRVLTQLRCVINAIIARHGRPDSIRVEMSREVKKTARERAEIRRENNSREKIRAEIATRLRETFQEFRGKEPKRSDIEKYLLWIECGRTCVYTGRTISLEALFSPEIEVEHIIPFSRSMDDSYANKTLCFATENRTKGNKTPWEAYAANEARWGEILERINQWPTPNDEKLLRGYSWGAVEKLRRFRDVKHPQVEDFIARQLVDTQYSTKLARRYLACLFDEPSRVQVTNGALTATLRRVTKISGLLGETDSGKKARDDHRHHVVDAMMVAVSTPSMVKALADQVSQCESKGERYWKRIQERMAPFFEIATSAVANARVSIYSRNRVRGSMHADTQYGIRLVPMNSGLPLPKTSKKQKNSPRDSGEQRVSTVRRTLTPEVASSSGALAKFASTVLDDGLRKYLSGGARLETLSNTAGEPESIVIGPNGKPVRKARSTAGNPDNLLPVGSQYSPRWLANDENHHIEIWTTAKGKWIGRVMNMIDAYKRKAAGAAVYRALGKVGETFVMHLHKQDVIEAQFEDSAGQDLWVVDGISATGQIVLMHLFDARPRGQALKAGLARQPTASGLQAAGARRVFIDPLGYIVNSD